jgi:hypothetical protein
MERGEGGVSRAVVARLEYAHLPAHRARPSSQKALIDQCNIFAMVAAAGLEPALRFPRSRF